MILPLGLAAIGTHLRMAGTAELNRVGEPQALSRFGRSAFQGHQGHRVAIRAEVGASEFALA
jgi:hypothetical protein